MKEIVINSEDKVGRTIRHRYVGVVEEGCDPDGSFRAGATYRMPDADADYFIMMGWGAEPGAEFLATPSHTVELNVHDNVIEPKEIRRG